MQENHTKSRVYKFRAWDIHGKRIVEWDELWENKGYLYDFMNGVIDNLIPLQFTGLKDKNGKEIYEGDIVIGGMNYSGEQFYKGYIHWFADGAEYWALADFSEFGGKWNDRFTKLVEGIDEDDDSTETDTLEIIGNIYENPELIK